MDTSPVPPEWIGRPTIAFVIDNMLTSENDLMQEVIVGVNRTRFIQLIESSGIEDYYMTNLVKCVLKKPSYSAAMIKICSEWIDHEFSLLKPKVVIACGKNARKIRADFYTEGVSRIVSSKKNEEKFLDLLRQANDKQK
jgi:uracil-DNA glycosylase family 4